MRVAPARCTHLWLPQAATSGMGRPAFWGLAAVSRGRYGRGGRRLAPARSELRAVGWLAAICGGGNECTRDLSLTKANRAVQGHSKCERGVNGQLGRTCTFGCRRFACVRAKSVHHTHVGCTCSPAAAASVLFCSFDDVRLMFMRPMSITFPGRLCCWTKGPIPIPAAQPQF